MNTKTKTTTEYAPFILTQDGSWRKLSAFCKSKESAERDIERHKKMTYGTPAASKDYKVMKRTVTVTTSKWEDA